MANKPQVEQVLRRLLSGGVMTRLPRSRKDTEIILALAASFLDPRLTYSEPEINEQLNEWLAGFTDPTGMDHVTVRRFMVDLNFLSRDQPGSAYMANQATINLIIEPSARSIQPGYILEDVQQQRKQRKLNAGPLRHAYIGR
jgi:hypothetical protein